MKNVNIAKNLKNVSGGFLICLTKFQAPAIKYETRCSTEYVWKTPKTVCRQVAVPAYS
tara:strand:- start:240 stop:413 length:174 start_codon:yes stop_codon:yes gene_type:complete